ncbi:ornithine cyclodeaminase family protein [Vitiosangium sp. GDMCC 1.1324]|uniref:ornithine cyclodeaminase family protein n=1 Tax=Vitiosangium sp. (strain GDMCC 1.1324) TaxID=2138576 RepID=UPI000D3D543C|nr:ornithine cyclodeaminase family protein [Vitiosangium sp. GDMCC 1.1324]PTL83292.1 ornithine cyclodeaminase [Vitiosangium sp. GDMCC 1.1324]
MSTLLLNRTDVIRHMTTLTLLSEMRDAFRADSVQRTVEPQRARAPLHDKGTALVVFPGTLPGIPAYTVKVHAKFPGRTPAIQGVVQLYDLETGALLAVMNAAHLTALRTGVVGALAADVLAREDAARVALIGAGALASLQLKSLRLVRSLEHARVYDVDAARAVEFAHRMYQTLKLPVRPAMSVEEAVEDADIVITATPSREPFLYPGMVRGGTHITALGADEPGKAEVSAGLLRQSTFFCDHRTLNLAMGAPAGVGLGEEFIHAELGEVLAGTKRGRSDAGQVTIFGAVGLPFQDLVAAWHVYQGARTDDSVQRVDFEV